MNRESADAGQEVLWVQSADLVLRPFEPADVALLERWLADERVRRLYEGADRAYGSGGIRELYLSDDHITRFVVEWKGRPIGYQQSYPLEPETRRHYGYDPEERVWGIDQFIGEPALWDRGLGGQQVRAVAGYLLNSLQAERVVTDPAVSNRRAIRSYEKAGFSKVKLIAERDPLGGGLPACWLMEFDP